MKQIVKKEDFDDIINEIIEIQKEGIVCLEENTKQWLINPFIYKIGFNPFSRKDVVCEMNADVRSKGGEKVDYGLLYNDKPYIIIEAKPFGTDLQEHIGQLKRYYQSSVDIKYAILTNAIDWWFFEDRKATNLMDDIPFYKLNLLNLTDNDIKFLNCFCKENFGKYENEFERFKTEIIVKDFIEKKIFNADDSIVNFVCDSLNLDKNDNFIRQTVTYNLRKSFNEDEIITEIENDDTGKEDTSITTNNFEDFKNRKPSEIKFLSETVKVSSWRQMLTSVCNILIDKEENSEDKILSFQKKYTRIIFSKDLNDFPEYARKSPSLLSNNYYVYNNLSSKDTYNITLDIVKHFGYTEDDLFIKLRD